jgi:hypothetical protein
VFQATFPLGWIGRKASHASQENVGTMGLFMRGSYVSSFSRRLWACAVRLLDPLAGSSPSQTIRLAFTLE